MHSYWEPKLLEASIQDIHTLNKIAFAAKQHWGYPDDWMEKWKEALTLTEEHFAEQSIYKLQKADKIIGYCSIEERETEYEVMNLWILPAYIGKGYGKLLLNETLKKVIQKSKPILVEADPHAEAFYASQGFISFSKRESYPKGRFLPLMKKWDK